MGCPAQTAEWTVAMIAPFGRKSLIGMNGFRLSALNFKAVIFFFGAL
jgi:hypothetical protein